MNVRISDYFALDKIIRSGQCFREICLPDSTYRFITGKHVLYIRQKSPKIYEVSCSRYTWNHIWKPYFNLDRDYAALENFIPEEDAFLLKAAKYSRGIRILKQDPWEVIVSFIISQRKSIPAIQNSIEKLCRLCGDPIQTGRETLYSFPSSQKLHQASLNDLKSCSLGYRAPYIEKTAAFFAEGKVNIKDLASLPDSELIESLEKLPGVGIKVANCVSLFGFQRYSRAPVDVWIDRVIREQYSGINPFPLYGKNAGIMQQYMFFYARHPL